MISDDDEYSRELAILFERFNRLVSDPTVSGETVREFFLSDAVYDCWIHRPGNDTPALFFDLFTRSNVVGGWEGHGAELYTNFFLSMGSSASKPSSDLLRYLQTAFAYKAIFSLVLCETLDVYDTGFYEEIIARDKFDYGGGIETDDFSRIHGLFMANEVADTPPNPPLVPDVYPLDIFAYDEAARLMPLVECLHTENHGWTFEDRLAMFTAPDDRYVNLAKEMLGISQNALKVSGRLEDYHPQQDFAVAAKSMLMNVKRSKSLL